MDINEFKPPKLPIAWIASTFIAPALIVILPYLFSAEDAPFTTLIIIALALLSLLLLIVCFALVLYLYSEAYKRQILEYQALGVKDRLEEIEVQLAAIKKKNQQKCKQKSRHR